MIDAIRARELMPTVQYNRYLREKRLGEISTLIEKAARDNQDSVFINIYDDEEAFLLTALKDRGFEVIDYPDRRTQNVITKQYCTPYKISW
jgi:hypothetical protein